MRLKLQLFLACVAFSSIADAAAAQVFRVSLAGANETPPIVSGGSGSAVITLNPTTHEMRVVQNFTGLTAGTTASHVHCCAAQPATVGVATTTPTFAGFPTGVTAGSMDRTYDMRLASTWNPAFVTLNGGSLTATEAAFIAGATAGRSYLNVHTTFAPGGEIRGILMLQTFAGNAALTDATRGVAAGLDSLGAGTGATSDAIVTLAFMTGAQQQAALTKLSPVASSGPLLTKTHSVDATFDQIDDRIADPALRGSGPGGGLVWMKAYGLKGDQGAEDGFAGYESDGWGVAAGVDRRVSDGLLIGAALSYADAGVSYRDQAAGGSDDFTSTQVSVYGAHDAGPGYIDAMAAYAMQSNERKRDTGLTGVASGSPDGSAWGLRIGGGAPVALSPGVSLTPQAHLDWTQVKQDAYVETGGGAMALTMAEQTGERFRGSLGAQLDFGLDSGGMRVRPFVAGFWNYDFSNDGGVVSASFTAGGANFLTPQQELEASSFSLGAGVNVYTDGTFSASLVYDATLSSSYDLHTLQATARWAF